MLGVWAGDATCHCLPFDSVHVFSWFTGCIAVVVVAGVVAGVIAVAVF